MSDGGSKRSSSSFHFVAGLGSGVFTAVLLQPADLLKTRVQQSPSASLFLTLRTIAAGPSPFRQLWRGTAPSAIRTGLGSALYFGSLNLLRQTIAHRNALRHASAASASSSSSSSSSLPKLSNLENLATGAIARAGAGFLMMPITVIKVRYESSLYSYTTLSGAGRDILIQDGLKGFFAGFGATAVRDAPYAGLYVLFYEQSKKRLSKLAAAVASAPAKAEILYTSTDGAVATKAAPPPAPGISSGVAASINFASGVLAAVTSTALTNPFDAIKTRLQLMPRKYGNMVRAAKLMLREEGVRSLFQGLGIRIGRKAIASALAWTVYEELIRRAEIRWAQGAAM